MDTLPSFQDMGNKLINISDLEYMFTVDIGANERSYDEKVKIRNNEYVREWSEKLLKLYANQEDKLTVKTGTDLWEVWNQGHEVRGMMSIWDDLDHPDPKKVEKWKCNFDELSMGDLVDLGRPALQSGFHILIKAYGEWYIKQKYEKVFFDDNFGEWYERYRANGMLFEKKIEPFPLKKYSEKVGAIMKNGIRPRC